MSLELCQQHIQRGIRDIFNAQLQIAEQRIYGFNRRPELISRRTGNLRQSLAAARHSVSHGGQQLTATAQVPLYIRFLDMKKHGNYKIYNRQIYGILYNRVLNRIRYGYTDEIAQQIRERLIQAGAVLR
jgi:hypothetical protein